MPAKPSPPTQPVLQGTIGFVLVPQFTTIALASAMEPLRIANRYLERPYTWRLLSLDGAAVADGNGILVQPHGSILGAGPLGTVIVCADARPEQYYSRELRRWLHQADAAGATLGALDTGCFLLARAGLLDGCRVTVHWEVVDAFRERFPRVLVEHSLFEIAPRRLTCAGGTAAIDMMLSAIAVDHGTELADRVAEHCMHDHIRPGHAAQRMRLTARYGTHHPAMTDAIRLLESTLDRAVGVPELAAHVGLSERQLLRLFSQSIGGGPARYHRRLRLEHARSLLRYTTATVTEAAVAAGFESLAHFCRVYRQQYGRAPRVDRDVGVKRQPMLRDAARAHAA
jgi:AraC family carnitine catabolism transcriptional activator